MTDPSPGNRRQYLGAGIAIGVAIGAGLGVAFGNLALGIGPGIAIGVALWLAMSKSRHSACEGERTPRDADDSAG